MSAQVRRTELRQRRTRKKKIAKLRKLYKLASTEERHRIEGKLLRIAFSTPTRNLLDEVATK